MKRALCRSNLAFLSKTDVSGSAHQEGQGKAGRLHGPRGSVLSTHTGDWGGWCWGLALMMQSRPWPLP